MKNQDTERDYITELEEIQKTFRTRTFTRSRPVSEFPELIITLPDELNTIELAPLYDVHIGSRQHDSGLLDKHLDWIANTPNVFTFNGGDAYENVTDFKMGPTPMNPEEQLLEAAKKFARVQHKMLFAIPGNHEVPLLSRPQPLMQAPPGARWPPPNGFFCHLTKCCPRTTMKAFSLSLRTSFNDAGISKM